MKVLSPEIHSDILEAQRLLKSLPNLARTKEEWRFPHIPFFYRIPWLKELPILYKQNDLYRAIWAQNQAKYLTAWDKATRLTLKEKIHGDIAAQKRRSINRSQVAAIFSATTIVAVALTQIASLKIDSRIVTNLPKEKTEQIINFTGNMTVFSGTLSILAAGIALLGHYNKLSIVSNEQYLRILEDSITLSDKDKDG